MTPLDQAKNEKRIHELFEISVMLKGAGAALESLVGILLLFVNVGAILDTLVANELIDDPNDFIATHVQSFAAHLTTQTQLFSALYLLSHGLVKIVLVWGLLTKRLWAYPASIVVLALFILYQVVKWLQTHSIMLALLTIFDLALIWLIWHEYRLYKKMQRDALAS